MSQKAYLLCVFSQYSLAWVLSEMLALPLGEAGAGFSAGLAGRRRSAGSLGEAGAGFNLPAGGRQIKPRAVADNSQYLFQRCRKLDMPWLICYTVVTIKESVL